MTLKTLTVMLTAIGVVGIIQVMVMATILPLKLDKPGESPAEKARVSSTEALASLENLQMPLRPQK